jgi:hypothetical protein
MVVLWPATGKMMRPGVKNLSDHIAARKPLTDDVKYLKKILCEVIILNGR